VGARFELLDVATREPQRYGLRGFGHRVASCLLNTLGSDKQGQRGQSMKTISRKIGADRAPTQ
jgi:hypothetical protein